MAEMHEGQQRDRTALVLYGSETGNSQDVAEELGRAAQRLHFVTRVCEMDQVDINSLLLPTFLLFVVGTTGQGEFPRNARKLWKSLLRKRLPADCLALVKFTTFGLGDSSYPKFNWAARKLHKRLEQLGAKEVYPRGEGDEQHEEGIDGTFLSWFADLRRHLLSCYPIPPGKSEIPADVLLPPPYTVAIREAPSTALESRSIADPSHPAASNSGRSDTHVNTSPSPALSQDNSSTSTETMDNARSSKNQFSMRADWMPEPEYQTDTRSQLKGDANDPDSAHADSEIFPPKDMLPIPKSFDAKLIRNERVTPASHWQDVRLLTFHVSEDRAYYPGDTVTIFPKNYPADVQALIDLQGWNDVADLPLVFEAQAPDYFGAENLVSKPPGLVPLEDSTMRELLLHNLDITAIPKRHFFNLIAHFTDDLMHRERLLEFTNPMYTDEFFDYTTRPRRSILEVLHDFPSVRLPWKWATTIFPPIRGRQFSICSGGVQQDCPGIHGKIRLQILVAIVKYRTVLKKIRQGLCSRYIAHLTPGSTLAVTMTPNLAFYKAVEASVGFPIIMVGPGTGVAPCRSLIWHRAAEAIEYPNQNRDMVLFFGNRNKQADYFFEAEWKNPTLRTEVFTAFSRDQREKIYVQDLIRRQGKLIHQLLSKNALIIVCGSSGKMPLQVRQAFIDVMEEYGGPWESRQHVEKTFEFLEKRGQYLQETW